MYRKRVELCLSQCNGGEKILEIGFGTGLTFINLNSMYKEIHGLDLTVEINKVRRIVQTPWGEDLFKKWVGFNHAL